MTFPWEQPPTGAFAAQTARFAALIPVLETERLRLRAPMIADFEVYRTTRAEPSEDREETWLDFCQMHVSWLQRGFGPWAIEDKSSGAGIGFLPVDHEYGDPEPEIGWFVIPERRRQGIAKEAARAVLDRGLPALGFRNIVSYIDANNAASLATAAALGGRKEAGGHPDTGVVVHRYHMEAKP